MKRGKMLNIQKASQIQTTKGDDLMVIYVILYCCTLDKRSLAVTQKEIENLEETSSIKHT